MSSWSFGTFFYPLIVLAAASFLLYGCTSPEGNAADGKRWYRMHNCHACHGENGNDGGGPKIAGLNMGYRSFVSRLRHAETPIMPVYPPQRINDQDAADILAFLKSLEK